MLLNYYVKATITKLNIIIPKSIAIIILSFLLNGLFIKITIEVSLN